MWHRQDTYFAFSWQFCVQEFSPCKRPLPLVVPPWPCGSSQRPLPQTCSAQKNPPIAGKIWSTGCAIRCSFWLAETVKIGCCLVILQHFNEWWRWHTNYAFWHLKSNYEVFGNNTSFKLSCIRSLLLGNTSWNFMIVKESVRDVDKNLHLSPNNFCKK